MFVITELEDCIEIRASSREKELDVLKGLCQKYTGKFADGLGLCVCVCEPLSVLEYKICSDILMATTRFQAMFQRFYSDEVCIGRICRQSEERMVIGDGLFDGYEIQPHGLFEGCEFEPGPGTGRWIWNYKGNRLVFSIGDTVMFRVRGMRFDDCVVEAAMDEQGLGPIVWWE